MGIVRKHLAGLIICSVLASQPNFIFTGNTTAAAAATATKKGIVTASSLNVRSSNNISAKLIGSVKKGTTVTIYSTKNGWYQISYGSTKGWVSADYVKLSQDTPLKLSTTSTVSRSAVAKKGIVTASSLNVRSANNITAKLIGSVKKGTTVTIYSTKNGWYQISYGSTKGWVSAGYVKLSQTNNQTSISKPSTTPIISRSVTTKKGIVTASLLTVRKSNSTKAAKIGSVKKGTTVTIYSTKNGWYQVSYGSTKGWVSADYVKLSQTSNQTSTSKPSTDSTVSRSVTTKKGIVTASVLTVRKSNSTKAAKMGSVKKGTTVTIYDTKNGWYQINYGSTKGWVSASYIKLSQQTSSNVVPLAEFSTPILNTNYVNQIPISGWALHTSGVKEVQVYLNNKYISKATLGDSTPTLKTSYAKYPQNDKAGFHYTLDAKKMPKGKATIKLKVIAKDGSIKFIERTVNIINPMPLHELESPKSNLTINNTNINIDGWSLHPSGIKQVKILLDGKYLGLAKLGIVKKDIQNLYPDYPGSRTSGYSYVIPVNNIPAGKHSIIVQSIANSGTIQSKTVSLTISKPTPKVAIEKPDSDVIPTDNKVKITGYALHGSEVKDYQVKVDGQLQENISTGIVRSDVKKLYPQYPNSQNSGFEFLLDISKWSFESHTVEVKITGFDGTTSSSKLSLRLPGVNSINYSNPLSYYVDNQLTKGSPVRWDTSLRKWRVLEKDPTKPNYSDDTSYLTYFMNVNNFMNDSVKKFMFLKLDFYLNKISQQQQTQLISQFNTLLNGKGILANKGAVYLEAGKQANVNPIYLISHSLLETGNGSSTLAKGVTITEVLRKNPDGTIKKVPITPCTVYNMYGIGAFDSDPIGWGTTKAYDEGWFDPDTALIEGANWIGQGYINNDKYKQYTLYKMRWNLDYTSHQYATDVEWAVKQTGRIKTLVNQMENPLLQFEVPLFSN